MAKNKKINMFSLFIVFFKIGIFTFGGGFAMIPLIEKEIVDNKGWLEEDELINILALAQTIPGAVAINSSSFIGYKLAGIKGSLISTTGVILPSFTIISLIFYFFNSFNGNKYFEAAFLGIRSCVVALILLAAIRIGEKTIVNKIQLILVLLSVFFTFLGVQLIFLIIAGGIIGISILPYFIDKKSYS